MTLLGACRKHKEMELAEKLFERMSKLIDTAMNILNRVLNQCDGQFESFK